MKVKVLQTFVVPGSGLPGFEEGTEREIADENLVSILAERGLVEPVAEEEPKKKTSKSKE